MRKQALSGGGQRSAGAPQKNQQKGGPQAALAGMPVADQWNCSSSVEPVSALTLDEPPWMTVVTSSK